MTTSHLPDRRHPGASLVAKTFEDGGKHYTTLSATFLLACLYVLVTVSSATHRALLLGGSLPLPLLSVPIPLTGFFVVAPALILVLHLHLLLQNHVLVKRLLDERGTELGGDADLLLFPSLPFLDNLWCERGGFRFLVSMALWMTNIILPLGLLCYTQYKFLPYHSFGITLTHQAIVALDVAVIWYFLFQLAERGLNRVGVLIVLAAALAFSLFLAVYPGMWIELRHCPPAGLLTRSLELPDELLIDEPPPPELLAVFETKGQDRMMAFVRHSIGARLAERDLRCADLEGAKLFNADLRGADLRGASLVGADLRHANLTPIGQSALMQEPRGRQKSERIAQIAGTPLKRTRLEKANLQNAHLEASKLILVSMRAANLAGATMSDVELTGADLREAGLEEADLAGAELSYAALDGARMESARLGKATLVHASLSGASLRSARADEASFVDAQIEGAQFTEAWLRNTDFRDARLGGSDFRRASLQGARRLRLEAVDLRGAHLGGMCEVDFVKLVDLRSVDFLSSDFWDRSHKKALERISGRDLPPADLQRRLARELDRVVAESEVLPSDQALSDKEQAACLGKAFGLSEYRYLMYHNEARTGPLEKWPLLKQQRNGRWDEAVFHRELAKNLLDRACSSEGLATTLVRRAAREYNPGDLELDLELARQLLAKLETDQACVELGKIKEPLKRRISWRVRKADREEKAR